jgi:hypothetical protein
VLTQPIAPIDHLFLRRPDDIIKTIILKRINSYIPLSKDHLRRDKTAIRNFIYALPDSRLVDELIRHLSCSEEQAQRYVTDFLAHCEENIRGEDVTDDALHRLMDYDVAVEDRLETIWKEAHTQKVQHAQHDLDDLKKHATSVNQDITAMQKRKAALDDEIAERQAKIVRQEKLSAQIAEEMKGRIATARENVASLFAEHTILFGGQTQLAQSTSEKANDSLWLPGEMLLDEPNVLMEMNDVQGLLAENLEDIGASRDCADAFAAYLLAAYFTRTPLILTGYGGALAADALSVSLMNKTANRFLFKANNLDYRRALLVPKGEIVLFPNVPDFSTLMSQVKPSSPYMLFTTTTLREWQIESEETYDFALPIQIDLFWGANPSPERGQLTGGIFDGAVKKVKSAQALLPRGIVSPYAYEKCRTLLGLTQTMTSFGPKEQFLFQVAPTMIALNRKEQLIDIIHNESTFSSKDKLEICEKIGVYNGK